MRYRPLVALLHLVVEEVNHAVEEMLARVAAIDAVVAVSVDLHLELLVVLHVGLADLGAVAEVHVVVGGAVDKE